MRGTLPTLPWKARSTVFTLHDKPACSSFTSGHIWVPRICRVSPCPMPFPATTPTPRACSQPLPAARTGATCQGVSGTPCPAAMWAVALSDGATAMPCRASPAQPCRLLAVPGGRWRHRCLWTALSFAVTAEGADAASLETIPTGNSRTGADLSGASQLQSRLQAANRLFN